MSAMNGKGGVSTETGRPVKGRADVGLGLTRRFTKAGIDPLDEVRYAKRDSAISNTDGSVVFGMKDTEAPEGWSQLATDILVSKYFRKAGVPGTGSEVSARQVVVRIARSIREAGQQYGGYFRSTEEAETFEAELSYMLIHQMGAFNSPVWFNCGLAQRYGITGKAVGCWYFDETKGEVAEAPDSYTRPQMSASSSRASRTIFSISRTP